MNRYPLWKYILIAITIVLAFVYALPNLYGDAPAVQVTAAKATVTVDAALLGRMEDALKQANIPYTAALLSTNNASVRFSDTDIQLRAKHVIDKALNPDPANAAYVVALNLVSASPAWLTAVHAYPMYLGLDLRGGVHFLLQVDMRYALKKRVDGLADEIRTQLRDKDIRYSGLSREGNLLRIKFRDAASREKARESLLSITSDLALADRDDGSDFVLVGTLKPESVKRIEDYALKQNITTLHNRINELGVAEPVIQQEGADRIVVELPGIQDTARAKEILGRTASLEVHMVDEDRMTAENLAAAAKGQVPFGDEYFVDGDGQPLLLKKPVVLTGDRITDAEPGFDSQTGEPAVHLTLDSVGARIFRDITRANIGKRMAIVLIDRGKGEVVTAPVIRSEIGGGRVQISGHMNTMEANNIALLLRAGALAAPMDIVEERTVGPSLGKENIQKGFDSTKWGFTAIVIFMSLYYLVFGVVSSIALAVNLLFLVALLSLLQATLTMPGIAAIALALGMAIDSNVLINERIREEIRGGATPQAAIAAGYERAWGTILDSNITTLIAGLSLLIFGTGPVRGFAVVHVMGILTSIFSAVVVSRGIVNLIYGHRRRVAKLSIGNTAWK
ncbi:MAG TPA: protein translocase subunit SecD [Burkholderiales bacterium]|nr:protein translocase subunit SecD [Burkholderiales bacterium]